MASLNLKPQHQDSALQTIMNLARSIKHFELFIFPKYSEMTDSERKESSAINEENVLAFESKKKYILENQSIFNELLSEYKISVTIFLVGVKGWAASELCKQSTF